MSSYTRDDIEEAFHRGYLAATKAAAAMLEKQLDHAEETTRLASLIVQRNEENRG